jgi:hypothetical protein
MMRAGLVSGGYRVEGWTCVASRRGKQLETMNIMTSDILRRSWRKLRHAGGYGLINDEQLVGGQTILVIMSYNT